MFTIRRGLLLVRFGIVVSSGFTALVMVIGRIPVATLVDSFCRVHERNIRLNIARDRPEHHPPCNASWQVHP